MHAQFQAKEYSSSDLTRVQWLPTLEMNKKSTVSIWFPNILQVCVHSCASQHQAKLLCASTQTDPICIDERKSVCSCACERSSTQPVRGSQTPKRIMR